MPRYKIRNQTSCLNFNGTTTQVDVPHSTSLNLTGNYSIGGWFYIRSLGEGSAGRIFEHSTGLDGCAMLILATNQVRMNQANSNKDSGTGAFVFNIWTHIVATFDGSNVRFYINSSLFSTVAQTALPTSINTPFTIGNKTDGTRAFDGLISDLFVYKGTVLTQLEIENIMFNNTYPTTNLSALWRFDEGSGTSAVDDSGNSNTGTISNGTYSTNVLFKSRTQI